MPTSRRADMFVDSTDDPRENGPALTDERTTLVELLRRVRLTLQLKCEGLDAEGGAIQGEGPISLREVMVEMISEYARHLGHADLLRERIDERIGQ